MEYYCNVDQNLLFIFPLNIAYNRERKETKILSNRPPTLPVLPPREIIVFILFD